MINYYFSKEALKKKFYKPALYVVKGLLKTEQAPHISKDFQQPCFCFYTN